MRVNYKLYACGLSPHDEDSSFKTFINETMKVVVIHSPVFTTFFYFVWDIILVSLVYKIKLYSH